MVLLTYPNQECGDVLLSAGLIGQYKYAGGLNRRKFVATLCGFPGVVTTALHSHHPACAFGTELPVLPCQNCVSRPDTLAKYAAALLNMSRSSPVRLCMGLSQAISPFRDAASPPSAPCRSSDCPTRRNRLLSDTLDLPRFNSRMTKRKLKRGDFVKSVSNYSLT